MTLSHCLVKRQKHEQKKISGNMGRHRSLSSLYMIEGQNHEDKESSTQYNFLSVTYFGLD